MKLGKTNQRVLEAVRREQPAALSVLMRHLDDLTKGAVRSALQNMRYAGLVRVEKNGRTFNWMPADAVPTRQKPLGKLSEWTRQRLTKRATEGEGDCLIWRGSVASSGAPIVYRNGQRLHLRKLIWTELHDREPPVNMVTSTTCGTHGCCNPKHVVLISRSERQNQLIAAGRRPSGAAWSAKMASVRQSRSRIDWEMVRRIRACSSFMAAVRMSGLPKGNVAQIWTRQTWRNDPADIWFAVFMRLAA